MRKVAHVLKPIKKQKLPKYVIFFDTETKETLEGKGRRRLTLKLGHAICTRRSETRGFQTVDAHSFTSNATFCRWLDARCTGKERFYVVAHNIAFDVRVTGIMRYLTRHGWRRTSLIAEGINFLASYRKGDTTIQLMNNQQLFNTSLRHLGESIGVHKGEVDFRSVDDATLLEYCKQDVEVMRQAWNAWLTFIVDNDLGPFKMTAASQAMAAYRYRFMHEDIFIHNDERTILLERESYHGGRTECMFRGLWQGGPVYNVDINSMYPYIMKRDVFPTKLRKHYAAASLADFQNIRGKYGYIAEATLRIERPVLPVSIEGRVCFPVGEVRGVFAKPELENALRCGTLLRVHRLAVYDERPIFAEFVDFFYGARLKFKNDGNDAFAYVAKLLLNSLYGKFGQKSSVWQVIGRASKQEDGYYKAVNAQSGEVEKIRIIDGIVERAKGFEEGINSFVAVASYVCAGARAYLSQLIELAGPQNTLYCDTDSLFLTEQGYANLSALMDKSQLGQLKLVGVSSDVEIYGPKWYRFGESTKSKGIRKDAVPLGEGTFEQDRFQSFNGALAAHSLDGVIVDVAHKKLSTEYRKGIVLPDGFVIPFGSPHPSQAPQQPAGRNALEPQR